MLPSKVPLFDRVTAAAGATTVPCHAPMVRAQPVPKKLEAKFQTALSRSRSMASVLPPVDGFLPQLPVLQLVSGEESFGHPLGAGADPDRL